MGDPARDPLSVVTPNLEVRGVHGLRVVDASVIPTIPSRNPNAAVLMIGEKGSDLLLDDSPVQLMERQHQSVADLIAVIEPAPDPWASTADATGQKLITSRLRMLGTTLDEHPIQEQVELLPVIHDHLTVAEWDAPQIVAMKNGPKGLRAPLMLAGTVLEDAEQSWFKSVMPPPARLLWWLIGRKGYEKYTALIRGDLARADIAVS